MTSEHSVTTTLDEPGLLDLPRIDTSALAWPESLPADLGQVLATSGTIDPVAAEEMLSALIDQHETQPALWWGLAVALARQNDVLNASTCYENFRDHLEAEINRAGQDLAISEIGARERLRSLRPALQRCRDDALVARGCIMLAGLEATLRAGAAVRPILNEALGRIRRLSPRAWGLMSDWLTTVAIVVAGDRPDARAVRTLRLALRLGRRDVGNVYRCGAIGRDLGTLLDRLDRNVEAESVLAQALGDARTDGDPILAGTIAIAQTTNFRAQRSYVKALERVEHALKLPLPSKWRANALLAAADILSRLGCAHRNRDQLADAASSAREAAILLEDAGLDPAPARHELALALAFGGSVAEARAILFEFFRAGGIDRSPRAYLAYLIRLIDGAPRKALLWASYRLRLMEKRGTVPPRDLLLLHEQAMVAAQRAGMNHVVRHHAAAMLAEESKMLTIALNGQRGPADWNRMRVAREAMNVVASIEADCGCDEARWRQAQALLAGRGIARAARRSIRQTGQGAAPPPDLRSLAGSLGPGDLVLALVSMHRPAPVDPEYPWASGFLPPRLLAIMIKNGSVSPVIQDLGDLKSVASTVSRWCDDLANGQSWVPPAVLLVLSERIRGVDRIFLLAEGAFERAPICLLAPRAKIELLAGLGKEEIGMPVSAGAQIVVAPDMRADPFKAATSEEIEIVRAAWPGAPLHIPGETGRSALPGMPVIPAHIHIIAHGGAVIDPRETDLDVYLGAHLLLGPQCSITASEVAQLDLHGVRLVVLSCCDTAVGAVQHAEGAASVAAAFLDAGAQAVVATLWPVPHEPTTAFMKLLYACDLTDPSRAVADAQLQAQSLGLPRACWAAWVVHRTGFPVPRIDPTRLASG